jgi:chorismate mutase
METLKEIRGEIKRCDEKLMSMLACRMELVRKIGCYKKKRNIPIKQVKIWNELLSKRIEEAKKYNIGEDCVIKIYRAIHQEAIKQQTRIFLGPGISNTSIKNKIHQYKNYFVSFIAIIYRFIRKIFNKFRLGNCR